jgi:hypothetical protein
MGVIFFRVSGRSKSHVFDGEIWAALASEEPTWHYAFKAD